MMSLFQFVIKIQPKQVRKHQPIGGFTLIELLVAIIMAALIITPLLGFAINILQTDRREQAKANTEQDIQAALDYIARDLEQAVYVYDRYGLDQIQDQLPDVSGKEPVLVFWKREKVPDAIFFDETRLCAVSETDRERNCNDAFPYSLVAYYLVQDNSKTWSDAARIERFQITDGIRDPKQPTQGTYPNIEPRYITDPNTNDSIDSTPDPGFNIFDLNSSETDNTVTPLEAKMNAWERSGNYDFNQTPLVALVDYIDQSTQNTPTPVDCRQTLGFGSTEDTDRTSTRMLTKHSSLNSLYACVNSSTNEAYIYIRGNALMRIQQNAEYSDKSAFFPSSTLRIQSRSSLGVE
ncbi:hormogonium polysaccharide secretion pseudopilin HpsC [Coleofasciculus chthonoplastes]|uniref:hormogonium polysaccharide secretion pseudopilin HpsC n=1 Tax=Coleofasciculus chthonoplastes TaxID=64178 RepID=UPI0032F22309